MKSPPRPSVSARSRAHGFTLIEILIGLVISTLITGSMIAVLVNSTSAYNIQLDHARVYENARFVMEMISRDVRMAGYFGCLNNHANVVNNLNAAPGSLHDIGAPLEGFENDGTQTTWLPSGHDVSNADILAGSDAITVRFANPTTAIGVQSESSPDAPIDAIDADDEFDRGRIAVVSNCERADVFQVTGRADGRLLSHATGGDQSPGNRTAYFGGILGGGYDPTATVMAYNAVRYYVRKRDVDDDDPAAPVELYREYIAKSGSETTEALVEGVENLQVLYGVDDDGDDTADQYVNATEVANWRNVVGVKVALLVRSASEYGLETERSADSFELLDETVTDDDGLRVRRHLFSTTIALRNTQ